MRDTIWTASDGKEYAVPVSFFAKLIAGEVAMPDLSWMTGHSNILLWQGVFRKKLSAEFAEQALRLSGDIDEAAEQLSQSLGEIVKCYSGLWDWPDVNWADVVTRSLGYSDSTPVGRVVTSYLCGSGHSMHTASIGVAIARANGYDAVIMGGKWPIFKPEPKTYPEEHYTVAMSQPGVVPPFSVVIPANCRDVRRWRQLLLAVEEFPAETVAV